jgi:nucleoside-diphosphate-sugar epimerase
MRLFILGANGFIGNSLVEAFCDYEVVKVSSTTLATRDIKLDLLKPDETTLYMSVKEGDIVLFLAAKSSPEYCSLRYKNAFDINVIGTISIISKLLQLGVKVLFFSSDVVYGQCLEAKKEVDEVSPFGEYALMKSVVEKYFVGYVDFKSIRLSHVFSRRDKFTRYVLECIDNDVSPEIYHPFFRSSIYIEDVIRGIEYLIFNWSSVDGQYINFGGPKFISRLEITKLILSAKGSSIKLILSEGESGYFMMRPKSVHIDSGLLNRFLDNQIRSIDTIIEKEVG